MANSKQRKTRSDKGVKRGPYFNAYFKKRIEELSGIMYCVDKEANEAISEAHNEIYYEIMEKFPDADEFKVYDELMDLATEHYLENL